MNNNPMPKEIYEKIIHVKRWLSYSMVKKRNNLDIYGVINYVFGEYIKIKNIDSKVRITREMMKEINESCENYNIDIDVCRIPKKDIDIINKYIFETADEHEKRYGVIDILDAAQKLGKLRSKSIVD
jgi:hypothetical protein